MERWLLPTVFVLACLLYLKADFFVSWDLSRYLEMARGLVAGQGLVYIDGAPLTERYLFPIILAGVLIVTGGSVPACTVVVSLIAACLPVLATALARRMFGIQTALATAGLLLFSPAWIFWAPRHIDPFWPLPLLACLIILSSPDRPGEVLRGLGCGLLAGLALFCKEISLLFVPVPLLAWLFRLIPGGPKRMAGFYLGFTPLLLAFAWLLFAGGVANQNPVAFGDFSIINIAKFCLTGLARFLGIVEGRSLGNAFGLALFLFAATIITPLVFYKSGQRVAAKNAGLLLLCFFCFLPASIFPGYYSWRMSQNLLGIALMFILLSSLMAWSADRLSKKFSSPIKAPIAAMLILAALTACGVFWQVKFDSPRAKVGYGNTLAAAAGRLQWPGLTLRGSTLYRWLHENHPKPCVVMVDYPPVRYGLGLFDRGRYRPVHLPVHALAPIARSVHALGLTPLAGSHLGPVLIYCDRVRPKAMTEAKIYFLFADSLWRDMRSGEAVFLAVYQKPLLMAMAAWAPRQPGLSLRLGKIRVAGNKSLDLYTIRAAMIKPSIELPTPVLINRDAVVYLRWLSKNRPKAWAQVRGDMLKSVRALTPEMLDALLEDRSIPGLEVIWE